MTTRRTFKLLVLLCLWGLAGPANAELPTEPLQGANSIS